MKAILSLATLAVLGSAAHATLIDFNDLASGTTLSNQYAGVTFTAGTGGLTVPNPAATTQGFATATNMSVVALSAANTSTAAAPLSGNALHSSQGWLNEDGDPVFTITFSSAISSISIDFGAINTAQAASTAIYAYNGFSGAPVASAFATVAGGVNQTVTLSGLSGVTTIAVTPGSYGDYVAVDNINYAPAAAVPEPATMAALGLGALALVRRKRKA